MEIVRFRGALASAALLSCACSATEPFSYTVNIPTEVAKVAARYELRVFPSTDCAPYALRDGLYDLARTATPTYTRTVVPPETLRGTLPSTAYHDVAVMETRAVDASGIPLASRCVLLGPALASAGFTLAQLAPTGATVTVTNTTALFSNGVRQDIKITVKDAMNLPASDVPISIGPSFKLFSTDLQGVALLSTPTTALGFDTPLDIVAYGVPAMRWPGRATVLAPPSCPAPAWTSDPLWSAPSGHPIVGPLELSSAADQVVIARPEGAERAVEVLVPVAGRLELMRAATTTVAIEVDGPIAAAIDPRDQSLLIAIGARGGRVQLLRYHPLGRRFEPPQMLLLAGASSGGSDPVAALAFIPLDPSLGRSGLDLLAGAAAHSPSLQRFAATASVGSYLPPVAALPEGEDVAPRDLRLGRAGLDSSDSLILSAAGELRIYPSRGDGSLVSPAKKRSGISGRIQLGAAAEGLGNLVLLADPSSGPTPDAEDHLSVLDPASMAILFDGAAGRGASAVVLGDLNGDRHPDLVVLNGDDDSHAVFGADGRGHFVRSAVCPGSGGATAMIPFDLDGDGRPEAIVAQTAQRTVAVLTLAP